MSTQRRIPICLLLALAAVLACAAPSFAHGPGVRAWLTTGDQASLLAEQPAQALGAPDPSAPTIAVDPARSYQRIEGLGASITLAVNGRELEIDSRPSDALALAVRSGAPIFAAEDVIAESAIEFEHEVEDTEEVVEKFKDFLENVTPEDFASGEQ